MVKLELEGFDEFCATHWAKLVRSMTLFTGDPALAEDLAQEAFLKAALRWGRVAHLEKPESWVRHVAMNAAKSVHRRQATARRLLHLTEPVGTSDFSEDRASSAVVRAALLKLTARDRQVLILRYFVGATTSEIAAELKISEGATRVRLSRASARLRPLLAEREDALAECEGEV